MTGYHQNSVPGLDFDFWLIKTDSAGGLLWQKTLGGSSDDEANAIVQTVDGGYLLTGDTFSVDGDIISHHPDSNRADAWVVKVNSSGAIQWQKILGGPLIDNANDVLISADVGYVVGGSSMTGDGDSVISSGGLDYWLFKLAPDTIPATLFSTAIDSSFLPKSWDVLYHEYEFRALRSDITIDSISLNSIGKSKFMISPGFQLPLTVNKGEKLRIRVNYDPLFDGANTATLSIASKQLGFLKSINLTGLNTMLDRPIIRVGILTSDAKSSLEVSAGQKFTVALTILDSFPSNFILKALQVKLKLSNKILRFESTSPEPGWTTAYDQSDDSSLNLSFSYNGAPTVEAGSEIASVTLSAFVSDSANTELSVDSLMINQGNDQTKRRLVTSNLVHPISISVSDFCGKPFLVDFYHSKQLIQNYDISQVVGEDGMLRDIVNFSLSRPAFTKILIYSYMGSYLGPVFEQDLDLGTHRILLRPGIFHSGTYFLMLQAENEVRVQPFVLLK